MLNPSNLWLGRSGLMKAPVYTRITKTILLTLPIIMLIIYMNKLLDSDWLRAVQFKCNTRAKSVTTVQTMHHCSGLQLAERQHELFQANDNT